MNIDQSHTVGLYMRHALGRKSRERLTTMIMNRSSHIPMLITIEMTNSAVRLLRTRFDHSNCGTTMLQMNSPHVTAQYGPNRRLVIMYHSYSLALYQAMKISIR